DVSLRGTGVRAPHHLPIRRCQVLREPKQFGDAHDGFVSSYQRIATAIRNLITSVGSGERNTALRRQSTYQARALGFGVRIEVAGMDASGLLGDASLTVLTLTPRSPDESAALLEVLHQLGQRRHLEGVLLAEVQRPLIEVALEAGELVPDALGEADRRDRPPLTRQPVYQGDLTGFNVPRAHLEPERHSL